LVEWTRKELAALLLAGFQMPHGKRHHPTLPQVNSLLRVAKRRLPSSKPKSKGIKARSSSGASKRRGHHRQAHQPRQNSVPRGNLHVAIPGAPRHPYSSNPIHSSRSAMHRKTAVHATC
jgi:hypothetical protein